MGERFPSIRCRRCWRSIHPLTRQVDPEDREVYGIPAGHIFFPKSSYSQLHFHYNGESFPPLLFEVQMVNDSYPRFLCVYLNNCRYEKLIPGNEIEYILDKMPDGITKITIEIHYGGWKEHGWQLVKITPLV